jgi:CheY-like chemotaxis protein
MEPSRIFGKRILLADDEPAVRDAIRLLLRFDRHIVSEARNASEALALYSQEPFDLVITDFEMPGMKGNELAARIKRLAPGQRILMITAYAEKLGDFNNPVDALLNKPFTFADLRDTISRLLSPADEDKQARQE